MRCEQVERRLNRLLDERRHWREDPALSAHCARCCECRLLAESYASLDLASLEQPAPQLSSDFAERVVAEMTGRTGRRVTGGSRRRLAVAALLLVAVLPAALRMLPAAREVAPPEIAAAPQIPELPAPQLGGGFAHFLEEGRPLGEEVWRTTGRGLAELPHQVRRAAALSEAEQLTGAIRPVAAAWEALRRAIAGNVSRGEPQPLETGLYGDLAMAARIA